MKNNLLSLNVIVGKDGKKLKQAMTILPKEEFEGELNQYNMLKHLQKNNVINGDIINVDEIVDCFIKSEEEKHKKDSPSNNNDSSAKEKPDIQIGDIIKNINCHEEKVQKQNNAGPSFLSNNYIYGNSYTPNYNPNYNPSCIVGYNYLPEVNGRRIKVKPKLSSNDDFTPLQAAEVLMEKYPFTNTCGALYFFSEGFFSILTPEKAYSLLIALGYTEISGKGNIAFLKDVYEILKVDPRIQKSADSESARYLAFNNCILDLDEWKMIPNNGSIFVTSKINSDFIDFKDEPYTPVFDKFIYDCAGGNPQKIILLMEIIGYYITSETAGKVFIVLVGKGDTGKSVMGKFLIMLFNSEAVSAVDLNDFGNKFNTYALVGRKLNASMDLPEGRINSTAASKLKQLTGDDLCKAEGKFINPFFFRNTCKFLFASNFPVTTAVDDIGFNNRLVVVNMNNVIPKEKQDKNLVNKLLTEKEGIIFKTLKYYLQYKKRNYIFTYVDEPVNINTYKSMNQVLMDFVNICCVFNPEGRIHMDEAYEAYKVYCINNGFGYYDTQSKFTIELKKILSGSVIIKKVRIGEKTKSGVIGLALLDFPKI